MVALKTLNNLIVRLLGAVVLQEDKDHRIDAQVHAGQGIRERSSDCLLAMLVFVLEQRIS